MNQEAALREAGAIAGEARRLAVSLAVHGRRLAELCQRVEDEIRRLGGELAFPVQTARNDVAAHFCPRTSDPTSCASGDLLKVDLGVHIDGWVVDTAVSVAIGGEPRGADLVAAAQAALDAAIAEAGPHVPVWRLSAAIEEAITSRGFRPMRNLCGHHVGRFTVHCPPPIPNIKDGAADHLLPGAVFAIEPFATTGSGIASVKGTAEVFKLREIEALASSPRILRDALVGRQGLPFSRRDLAHAPEDLVEQTLARLLAEGALVAYPPLVEMSGHPVSQAEHTLLVTEAGVVVLTA